MAPWAVAAGLIRHYGAWGLIGGYWGAIYPIVYPAHKDHELGPITSPIVGPGRVSSQEAPADGPRGELVP